ncbi:MAG: hypothetical protein IPI35_34055 [Deltaproteobacteria bacterium]|nr:hypothetical protein [Deltaproteobacteria bacterium]
MLLAQIVGLQVLSALNQVKGALEHGGPIATDPDPLLRSRDTIFVGWPLFWPFFVSIVHFEQPLVPSVPWYALPRFHRALRGVVPQPLHGDVFNRARLRPLAGRIGRISGAVVSPLARLALAARWDRLRSVWTCARCSVLAVKNPRPRAQAAERAAAHAARPL